MGKPLLSDRFQSLIDENRILRQEIRVAREAAEITASLVVKQFEETEKMLVRFQKANALQQAVLNSTGQTAIIAADRESCITVFNAGAENLLGYKAEEMIDLQTPEIFLSETELMNRGRQMSVECGRKIEVPCLLFEYALQGRVQQEEWTFIRKDGSRFPAAMSVNALKDSDGTANGFLCFATDISEKKQAEKSLRESEKKFRLLINNLPNIVARGYVDGCMDVFDDKIEILTGYTREEFLSRKIRWWDIIVPEDRRSAKDAFWKAFGKEDKSYTRQYRIRAKDGRAIWIEEGSQIICNESGEVEYISGAFLDVTERKLSEEALKRVRDELELRVAQRTAELARINEELQNEIRERRSAEEALKHSEEKYRGIFENATEGIFQTTPEGRILTANSAFARIMGYDSAEEIIRTIRDLREQVYVYPEKRDEFKVLLKEYGVAKDFETQYYRKDGSVIHISMNARSVYDNEGNILYYEGMLKNITQRKRAEQLKIEKDAAEAAALAKSEFLANMSHEIRTPLNAVIGLTDLLMRTKLDPKQKDYLEKIQISAHSLLRIINDILDFSKIEAGKLHLEDAEFQLRDILDNLLDMLSGKASEKGIELIISVPDDVPCALVGDPLRLGQIIINLAANAIKFTDDGEVIIQVSLIKRQADRVRLRFSVKDSGIGISGDQSSRLFSAFTQADSSTTRKYGGTGLGLVISRRLVEMMSGEIWAESELGMGSTFFFTAEFGLQPHDNEIKLQIPDKLRHIRVLIVDDNASSRKILQEYLRTFDFDTTSVDSGKAALEELSGNGPLYDLIIIDWMMPEIDGIATVQKIRENSHMARIPVILMTAFGREEVMKQAEAASVNGFLLKPIKQSVLLDTIMDVFGHETIITAARKQNKLSALPNKEQFTGAKVLLAEDNAINQQVATEILSSAGIIVETANNGQEAIRAIFGKALTQEGYPYDAVLMDVQMPEMDGYEATRIIRSDAVYRNLPVIAMTAHAMKGDKERCLDAGMNDYVTKPIDTDKLFEVLGRWINKQVESVKCQVLSDDTEEKRSVLTHNTLHLTHNTLSDLPGIDIPSAMKRLSGNAKLLISLIKKFGQTYANTAQDIGSAISAGDFQTAARLVHTVKGVAGNISATELYEFSLQLEEVVRNGRQKMFDNTLEKFKKALLAVVGLSRRLTSGSDKTPMSEPHPPSVVPSETIGTLMLELESLLKDNDIDAEEFFDSVKPHLVGRVPDREIAALKTQIDALEFDNARNSLGRIAAILNLSLSEGAK